MTDKDWKKFKDELNTQSNMQENEDNDSGSSNLSPESEEIDAFVLEHPSYRDLEEKLTVSEQKAHESLEKSVRALAELDNVRRRAERDIENAHRYSLEKFAKELLPVIDSLEQALQLADKQGDSSMHEGLVLTMKLFLDVLEKFGVQQLDPIGGPFNPQEHEAMAMQPSDDAKTNTVLTVFQKGYTLNDRVIRPARVIVAK